MTDIFMSYARSDSKRVEVIVNRLKGEGYTVWWDRNIAGGQVAPRHIWNNLNLSRCVIVVWSQQSLKRDWVIGEAESARLQEKYLPVRIDTVELPPPYNIVQCIDLCGHSLNIEMLLLALKVFFKNFPHRKNLETKTKDSEFRFIKTSNDTITDQFTQLMWQKLPENPKKQNLRIATALSKRYDLGGHMDWRLPSISELRSLVTKDITCPIYQLFIANTPNDKFWSSTRASNSFGKVIDFSSGTEHSYSKTKRAYFRYVRDV